VQHRPFLTPKDWCASAPADVHMLTWGSWEWADGTGQVLQVHLEQAMLEIKDHFKYIEKKIHQIIEEQQEMNKRPHMQDLMGQRQRSPGKAQGFPEVS
jgi:hypothetical protein